MADVDARALERHDELVARAETELDLARKRHRGNLRARLGEFDGAVAECEPALERERAVGAPLGDRFVLEAPANEAQQALAGDGKGSVEARRRGPGLQHAVEPEPGSAGQIGSKPLELERAAVARRAHAQVAHRLAAEIELIDLEGGARIGLGGQQGRERFEEAARRLERRHAIALEAVEVEPARGERHIEAQLIAPRRGRRPRDQLGRAALLEGRRNIRQLEADGIAAELGAQVELGRTTRRRLGGDYDIQSLGFESAGLAGGRRGRRSFEHGLGGRRRGALVRSGRLEAQRHLGGEIAFDARARGQIADAAVENVGIAACGRGDRNLETHVAGGTRARRREAHQALAVAPSDGSPELVRSIEGLGRKLAVDVLEAEELGAIRPAHGEHAVDQVDRLQRHVARDERNEPGIERDRPPVPDAVLVDRELHRRALQLHLIGLEHAAQKRGHGEVHDEALGPEDRRAALAAGVGNPELLEAHERGGQEAQVDRAADAHLAAEDARGLLLEHAAIAVPVDEIRHREEHRERHHEKAGEVEKRVVHSRCVCPASAAKERRSVGAEAKPLRLWTISARQSGSHVPNSISPHHSRLA